MQKDVISKQQFDAAVAQATADKASVLSAQATLIAQQDAVRQMQQKLIAGAITGGGGKDRIGQSR